MKKPLLAFSSVKLALKELINLPQENSIFHQMCIVLLILPVL